MDPSMMQSAMEAMSRASPDQLEAARRQMAGMSPEKMQQQMRMFQNMTPQQQADVRRQAASMGTPGAPAGQLGSQGPLQALNAIKAEGNKLHTAGQYGAACAKYEQVLSSIRGDTSEEAAALAKSCTLNLSSCYLNQGKHQLCIEACSRILASEPSNRKALYRRGQAHLAASHASAAIKDLRKALATAPADERDIIRGKLEAARKLAAGQGMEAESEEEIEEINAQPPPRSAPAQQASYPPTSASGGPAMPPNMAEQMRGMADQMRANPAMAAQMRSMMQGMDSQQFKMMAKMSGMGDVPDISAEQLRQASEHMAGMSPDDLARAADVAQAQQMRNGPSPAPVPDQAPSQNAGSSTAGPAEVSGRTTQPGSSTEASTSAPAPPSVPAAAPGGGFDFAQAAAMMQSNPDMVKQAMDMMSKMPPEQMENMRRMAMGGDQGQPGGMGAGGLPDMSAIMNDPSMLANMQSMFNSLTPAQMVDMAKQAGVNLNEQQAEQISTQLKKLKPWQLQMLARGATFVQWLQRMTYQQKMIALAVLVLLVALFLRWLGWV